MNQAMKWATMAAIFALGACAASPSTIAPPPAPGTPAPLAEAITISVGPCFGFCPIYEARITPEGTVYFDGKRHTTVLGKRERRIGAASYRQVGKALGPFRPATGTTARVDCEVAISDTSSFTISWTDGGGQTTTAEHRRGCHGGPGEALDKVLDEIPSELGIDKWAKQITRPGEPRG